MSQRTWDWKAAPRRIRDSPRLNGPVTSVIRGGARVARQPVPTWVQLHVPRVGVATGRLPDGTSISLMCHEPEIVANALYWRGWPATEPELLPLWWAAAREAETVVDVGAHVGQHAITAALARPSARVIALEALPRTVAALRENVRLNRCTNVSVVAAAAGDCAGRSGFYSVVGGLPSSSGLVRPFIEGHGQVVEETDVLVVDLDSLLVDPQAPLLLKVDTETTEPDVLAGAAGLLEAFVPMIFLEVLAGSGTADRLDAQLGHLDYAAYLLTADGPVERPRISEDDQWRNHLLVPRSGPSASLARAVGLA